MRRLRRALAAYFAPGSCLTWRTCWRHAKEAPHFQLAERDGFLYVEPKADARNVIAGVPQDVQ